MTEQEYLTGRVDDQIAWYDRKSTVNQKGFKILRITEIAGAAVIPLLAGQVGAGRGALTWVVGGLGAMVAIAAGMVSLYRLQENWIQYRAICEALRHEKFLYLTRVEPYVLDGAFSLFVQRVESLISKEHSSWAQYMHESTTSPGGGGTPGS